MREQTNNIEVSMSPGDIRNLPLTCYFTVWAAGVSNPAPRIKSRTGAPSRIWGLSSQNGFDLRMLGSGYRPDGAVLSAPSR